MSQLIRLARGGRVSWKGEGFVIAADPDGSDGVLAKRLSDGQRQFLPMAEIDLLALAEGEDSDGAGMAATNLLDARGHDSSNDNDGGASTTSNSPREKEPGRWKRKLAERIQRVLPAEIHQTAKTQAAVVRARKHFESLLKVLQLPRGSADRAAQTLELTTEWGYSLATAYRNLAIAEEGASAERTMRAVRSDKGRIRLSDAQWEAIKTRFDKHRFVSLKEPMEDIRVLINGDLKGKGEPVSLRTLYNAEKALKTKRERLLAEGRKELVRNQFGSRAGRLPDADFPLAVVQIDHTPLQIVFVDEDERKPLRDAWLTLVIDCFSRMVLGYHLSFDAPSTVSAGMALANAFLPKEEFLDRVRVPGRWPCWGAPVVIVCDNAAELNGYMMQSASRRFFFDIRDRPVDGPQFGGHIESAFKTFMSRRRSFPGTKFSNPTERGEYASEDESAMTLNEFDQFFAEFLINDYHLAEHRGEGMKKMAPLQRWEAGIFDGDVFPPTGLPDRPSAALARQIRISLLPIQYRVVSKMAVKLENEIYYSHALASLSDKVDPDDPTKERKHEIRSDPRNMFVIWVRDPDTGEYIDAQVQNVHWTYRSLWECQEIRRRWGNPATELEDERYQSKLRQEGLIVDAKTKTKVTRRRNEQEKRNKREAVVPAEGQSSAPARPNPLLQPRGVSVPRQTQPSEQARIRVPKIEE